MILISSKMMYNAHKKEKVAGAVRFSASMRNDICFFNQNLIIILFYSVYTIYIMQIMEEG